MQKFFLEKIRLSVYFWSLLIIFTIIALVVPHQKFSSGALALFSVNSFLYGFYIAPILSSQKARIDELHKIARSEANAVFAIALSIKSLPSKLRNEIQDFLLNYLKKITQSKKTLNGEDEYEDLITYCIEYDGENKEQIMKLLDKLVANQQNRTNLSMQMGTSVFSNEWSIMFVLFGITIGFVITMDTGGQVIYRIIAALLCTGLSMLIINLIKMSTLTHKRAKKIWDPYKQLIKSRFYRIEG